MIFFLFILFLDIVSGAISTNINEQEQLPNNFLIYGNGNRYTPEMIKKEIKTALKTGIKLDPFCIGMMEAINSDDFAIEAYYAFIFDGYEHSINHFYPEQPDSWDFLLNQSFIQYLERQVELEFEKVVEESIIKRLIVPKYPILKEFNYEFDSKTFLEEEICFRGDLTGHFEKFQTICFFQQLKNIIWSKNREISVEFTFKALLTTARKGLRPEAQPYADFFANIPIEVMKAVYFPSTVFSADFEHSLMKFVTKSVYSGLKKKSPEILEEIMKNLSDESVEMKYFKFLMKFHNFKNCDWFIITNPLEFYLMQATEKGNYERIKILKESLNFLKKEFVDNVFDLAMEKDDSVVIELLLDERILENFNNIGVKLFNAALRNDKRNILDSFYKGKIHRPSLKMIGDSLLILFKNGNFDHLIYILDENYKIGLNSKNLVEILILSVEMKNERIIKRILSNESSKDSLIFKDDLQRVFRIVLEQGCDRDCDGVFELMKLFMEQTKIIRRIDFKDFMKNKFLKAFNDKNLDLIDLFLESDCIDEDLIFSCHMEAIEKECYDLINLFEYFFSYKNIEENK